MDLVQQLVGDYTLRTVAAGAAVLGLASGGLGSFAVLRRQSLLGDAMSHAALPGIAVAFLLTGSKAPLVLVLGAALSGWLGALLVLSVTRSARVRMDSALGLLLSVFFGFGLVLLTIIQRRPDANQAGLESYLFGQAAALLAEDVRVMSILAVATLVLLAVTWKECKLLAFDREFGESMGISMRRADLLLTSLLVVSIVIGLQTVGVVLMSALLITPAAAARQWTDRLSVMVLLAGVFGALAGVTGAVLSATTSRLPTGPVIVLCSGALVALSLLFAPNRGVVWQRLRAYRSGRRLRMDAVLLDLYALASQHAGPGHPHDRRVLDMMARPSGAARRSLRFLAERGYVVRTASREWALTESGAARARELLGSLRGVEG